MKNNPLNKYAFFFQGDSILLHPDIPNSKVDHEIPLEFADLFDEKEIFEIPNPENSFNNETNSENTNLHEPLVTIVSVASGQSLPPKWRNIRVRDALFMLNVGMDWENSLVKMLKAFHISQWRDNSHYCGKCGTKNVDVANKISRKCPACGKKEFPKISPAIMVLIVNDNNEILLEHYKNHDIEMYSNVAGYVDVGESLEETVKREIREEINIEVKDINYIKSQPWPFPNSLMIGFYARYSSGTIQPDGVEIDDAKWFSKDDMPKLPPHGSLSRFLIDQWLIGELL